MATTSPKGYVANQRPKVAINLFKKVVLGDLHIPNRAQTQDVFNIISQIDFDINEEITERTWQYWFAKINLVPKRKKIVALDKIALCLSPPHKACTLGIDLGFSSKKCFFENLVFGGLVNELRVPNRQKRATSTLKEHIDNYMPTSAVHLLLDAIEVGDLKEDINKAKPEGMRKAAVKRIFTLLHARWNLRDGYIFSQFEPDFRKKTKRGEKLAAFTRNKALEDYWNRPPKPDVSLTNIALDASPDHVYKTLFSIAADDKFLIDERLPVWALDMVTAMFALFAYCEENKHVRFDRIISPEVKYMIAFDIIFFNQGTIEDCLDDLAFAMNDCGAIWNEGSFRAFEQAREFFNVFSKTIVLFKKELAG